MAAAEYEMAAERYNRAVENARKARDEADRAMQVAEAAHDEFMEAAADLRRYETSPGIPKPEYRAVADGRGGWVTPDGVAEDHARLVEECR